MIMTSCRRRIVTLRSFWMPSCHRCSSMAAPQQCHDVVGHDVITHGCPAVCTFRWESPPREGAGFCLGRLYQLSVQDPGRESVRPRNGDSAATVADSVSDATAAPGCSGQSSTCCWVENAARSIIHSVWWLPAAKELGMSGSPGRSIAECTASALVMPEATIHT